jgi:HlyD family secretion protein
MAGTKIPLTFVRIEPYVVPKKSLTGENTERVDTRVLQIIYRFDRPAFPIYAGQQVDVFIERRASNNTERARPSSDPLPQDKAQ